MKKSLILLAIMLTGTVSKAEDYALEVTLYEGTTAKYVLNAKPVVSYSEDNVIIKTQSLEDTYTINEVKSFTFVENASVGIEAISHNVTYDFRDDILSCEGHNIRVFNISGQIVASGYSSVSLEALACGIYIVHTGNRSIKILKK